MMSGGGRGSVCACSYGCVFRCVCDSPCRGAADAKSLGWDCWTVDGGCGLCAGTSADLVPIIDMAATGGSDNDGRAAVGFQLFCIMSRVCISPCIFPCALTCCFGCWFARMLASSLSPSLDPFLQYSTVYSQKLEYAHHAHLASTPDDRIVCGLQHILRMLGSICNPVAAAGGGGS